MVAVDRSSDSRSAWNSAGTWYVLLLCKDVVTKCSHVDGYKGSSAVVADWVGRFECIGKNGTSLGGRESV